MTEQKSYDKLNELSQERSSSLITEQWNNLERFRENFIREDSKPKDSKEEKLSFIWKYWIKMRFYRTKFDWWLRHHLIKLRRTIVLLNSQRSCSLSKSISTWEFDPGSGWTLAACLTHASRTKHLVTIPSGWRPCDWVADGWVTRGKPAMYWGITVGNGC